MRKAIIILVSLSFMFISCKKERLKGEGDIFVGEWRLASTIIKYTPRGGGCFTDTIKNTCKTKLKIKKSGRATLLVNGEKEKFLLTYTKSITNGIWEKDKSVKYGCTSNQSTATAFHFLSINFYSNKTETTVNPGSYINENTLILTADNDNKIIGNNSAYPNKTCFRFWERIN